jgi:hypothetical protein
METTLTLIYWTGSGSINLSDSFIKSINTSLLIKGGDKLRDILLKESYKNIFITEAKSKNIDKSKEFIDAFNQKKKSVLSKSFIKFETENIPLNNNEISQFFKKNIKDYQSSPTSSFYITSINCLHSSDCQNILTQRLTETNFQEQSKTNKNSPSGYYQDIALSSLNKKIQQSIKNLKINEVSSPIKLANDKYIFILVEKFTPAATPLLKNFENDVKKRLLKLKSEEKLRQLETNLIAKNPDTTLNSRNDIFAKHALNTGLDNHPIVKKSIHDAYTWLLADYGFFESSLFHNTDLISLRKELVFNQSAHNLIPRFDISFIEAKTTTLEKEDIIQITNQLKIDTNLENSSKIQNLKQLSKSEFNNRFKNLSMNPMKLKSFEMVGPLFYNDKVLWLQKTFQGIARNDDVLLEDYKLFTRSNIGSFNGFMQHVGHRYNVKINPIIYSKKWSEIAKNLINATL